MGEADRFAGADLKVFFISSGGTTADLSGDFRKLDVKRTQQTWDATAGADGAVVNKPTIKEYSATLETMFIGTAGTAAYNTASLGAEGALEYAPKGTASGNPKGSIPVLITEQPFSTSYKDGTMTTIAFAGRGAETSNPFVDTY